MAKAIFNGKALIIHRLQREPHTCTEFNSSSEFHERQWRRKASSDVINGEKTEANDSCQ